MNVNEWRMKKLQRCGGSGLPEGGAPFQQLVTDANGVAKWAERLAYAGTVEQPVVPETTCEFVGSGSAHWNNAQLPSFALELDKEYKVAWNGTSYVCVGMTDGNGGVLLGNSSLLGSTNNTGEPFAIFYNPSSGVSACSASSGNHTFSIMELVETVKTIDPKYLPGGGSGDILVIHANFVLPEDFDVLKQSFECEGTYDRPWQEVLDAVMNNKICLLQATVRLANGDMYICTTIDFDAVSWTEEHEICSVEFRKTIGVPVMESGLKLYFNTFTCSVFRAEAEFPEYAFLYAQVNKVSAEEVS